MFNADGTTLIKGKQTIANNTPKAPKLNATYTEYVTETNKLAIIADDIAVIIVNIANLVFLFLIKDTAKQIENSNSGNTNINVPPNNTNAQAIHKIEFKIIAPNDISSLFIFILDFSFDNNKNPKSNIPLKIIKIPVSKGIEATNIK